MEINPANSFNLEQSLLQNGYISIPLERLVSGHLVMPMTLNHLEGRFILDTGAGGTVIEAKRQAYFSMEAEFTEETATGAGATGLHMQLSKSNILQLERLELADHELTLMNLDHVNQAFAALDITAVDGVVGADILEALHAIIDYANLTLYLKAGN